ncbi:ribonuclease H-like domain-containing protein, partial [Tanacetum coccineum]
HVYSENAAEVWKELKDTYDKLDGSILFNLIQKINNFKQNGLPVSEYYHKLNSLWREFDMLTKFSPCTCNARTESEKNLIGGLGLHLGSLNPRCFEIIGYPPGFKKNPNGNFGNNNKRGFSNNNNRGGSSNNVEVQTPNGALPFTNDQIAKLMSLISEKENSGVQANMAGANQHITNSTKNMTNVVDISELNIWYIQNGTHLLRLIMLDLKKEIVLGTGSESGGLYVFDIDCKLPRVKNNFSILCCHVSKCVWHKRLGHPSDQVLKVLKSSLKLTKPDHNDPCDIYHFSKQTREPFPLSDHTSESLGDLIHLDLWGPVGSRVTS